MGPATIARVKPSNLYITCLPNTSVSRYVPHVTTRREGEEIRSEAHAGTAGAISLRSCAAAPSVLGVEAAATFRRVAMLDDMREFVLLASADLGIKD